MLIEKSKGSVEEKVRRRGEEWNQTIAGGHKKLETRLVEAGPRQDGRT